MKKNLFFCLIVGLFSLSDAFAGAGGDAYRLPDVVYKLSDYSALTEWGNPYIDNTYIQDSNREPKSFRLKQGWGCCSPLSWSQWAALKPEERTEARMFPRTENKDDVSVMVFVARKIYAHGGRFCLTQLTSWSSDRELGMYVQQANWPKMPCVTLCEPGWDGKECKEKNKADTGNDTSCDTTDIATDITRVKQQIYQDNDALGMARWRLAAGDDIDFFARSKVANHYEHVIFLGATDFMQHGVVAQPMLLGSVGTHPAVTELFSGAAASGKIKTLCAQGFTRNDKCEVSSKNCGSNVWCNGYSDSNFKSNIHVKQMKDSCNIILCKDRSKALDSNFNCVEYDNTKTGLCEKEDSDSLYGKLVECGEGYIFNKDTCKCDTARYVKSKDEMRYGQMGRNTEMVNDQCWTKIDSGEFRDCVLGTTSSTKTE